jgi:hypothetical protein
MVSTRASLQNKLLVRSSSRHLGFPALEQCISTGKWNFCSKKSLCAAFATELKAPGAQGATARTPGWLHGVIRFQHRRKINCGSYSEHTCAHNRPHDPRKLLVIEGLELLKTRSCCEYHPLGLSKKVRTAMGRQIFTANADHASTSV